MTRHHRGCPKTNRVSSDLLAPSSTMEEQSEERSGDHAAAVDEDPSTAPVPEHVRLLRATRARRDGEESPRAFQNASHVHGVCETPRERETRDARESAR